MFKPWSTVDDKELKLLKQIEEEVRWGLCFGMSFAELNRLLRELEKARK